jgi:hypothetical protein
MDMREEYTRHVAFFVPPLLTAVHYARICRGPLDGPADLRPPSILAAMHAYGHIDHAHGDSPADPRPFNLRCIPVSMIDAGVRMQGGENVDERCLACTAATFSLLRLLYHLPSTTWNLLCMSIRNAVI